MHHELDSELYGLSSAAQKRSPVTTKSRLNAEVEQYRPQAPDRYLISAPINGPPSSGAPPGIHRHPAFLPPASARTEPPPWHIQHSEVPPAMAHFYRELRAAAGSAAPPARRVAPASWSPPATADWKPFDPFESLSKQEEEQEGAAAAPPPSVSDCRAAVPSRFKDDRIPRNARRNSPCT